MGANGGRRPGRRPAPKARAEGAPLEKNGLFACRRRIFQGKNSIHVGRLRRAHSPQRGGRLRRSPVSTPTLTRRAPSAHPASLGGRLRRIATSRHCPSGRLWRTAAHEPRARPHACTHMQMPRRACPHSRSSHASSARPRCYRRANMEGVRFDLMFGGCSFRPGHKYSCSNHHAGTSAETSYLSTRCQA